MSTRLLAKFRQNLTEFATKECDVHLDVHLDITSLHHNWG